MPLPQGVGLQGPAGGITLSSAAAGLRMHRHACSCRRCPRCPSPPQATHEDFANKLYGAPSVSSSARFSKPKLSRTDFTINHYAGGWAVAGLGGWGRREGAGRGTCPGVLQGLCRLLTTHPAAHSVTPGRRGDVQDGRVPGQEPRLCGGGAPGAAGRLVRRVCARPVPARCRRAGCGRPRRRAVVVQVLQRGVSLQAPAGRPNGRAAHHGAALHPVHQAQLLQPPHGL